MQLFSQAGFSQPSWRAGGPLTQALLMPPPPALRRRPSSHPSSFFHSDRTARHAAAGREGGGREGGVDWEELLADPKEGEQVVDLDFIDASSLISQLQDADGRGVDGRCTLGAGHRWAARCNAIRSLRSR